jgi:tRNA-Thr(GGU) m(6)t(6)A37 methyltransferase TsaA
MDENASSSYVVRPIGRVESPLTDTAVAPKQGFEGSPEARLVFDPAVRVGLADLEVGERVVVLSWLDRADRSLLRVFPRDDLTAPQRGVFSTRSADRPNPIGLHVVEIVAVDDDGLTLTVRDLEAVDGTPVVDVKPVLHAGPDV